MFRLYITYVYITEIKNNSKSIYKIYIKIGKFQKPSKK